MKWEDNPRPLWVQNMSEKGLRGVLRYSRWALPVVIGVFFGTLLIHNWLAAWFFLGYLATTVGIYLVLQAELNWRCRMTKRFLTSFFERERAHDRSEK